MKKLFSLLTVFVMTVSLVGCGISPIDNANPTKIVKI
jgi:uncharacterized lipoprotein YehR (DUF1307 family)